MTTKAKKLEIIIATLREFRGAGEATQARKVLDALNEMEGSARRNMPAELQAILDKPLKPMKGSGDTELEKRIMIEFFCVWSRYAQELLQVNILPNDIGVRASPQTHELMTLFMLAANNMVSYFVSALCMDDEVKALEVTNLLRQSALDKAVRSFDVIARKEPRRA